MLKLVPFNPQWVSAVGPSGTPLLDIHAIYRRPHQIKGPDGEWVRARDEAGFGEWTTIGRSPMAGQNHRRKIERGFQFVTLADRESLDAVASPTIAAHGVTPLRNWQDYVQNPNTQGPFWPAGYVEWCKAEKAQLHEALIRDIREFGPEKAELDRQRDDPGYRIPAAFLAKVQAEVEAKQAAAAPPPEPDPPPAPPKRKRGRPPKARAVTEGVDA